MKLKAGNVFKLDLEKGFCLGQIFYTDHTCLYVGIFDELFDIDDNEVDPSAIAATEILFAHETLDALFYHKIWQIIGNYQANLDSVDWPNYRVGYQGEQYLETLDREIVRRLEKDEILALRNRKVVAPIRIDQATKAHFGEGEWQLHYEDLRYDYPKMSSKLLKR